MEHPKHREDLFQLSESDALIQQRYNELRQEIRKHNRLYFDQADPEISDHAFDMLMRELLEIEAKFPAWISPDSPSQRVGEKALQTQTDRHIRPMISLDKVFDIENLEKFTNKIFIDHPGSTIHAELKMDGCAVAVHYRYGKLVCALTRGNGEQGDRITDKLALMLPQEINQWKTAELIELRGEIYLPFSRFEHFNNERAKNGEKVFANPRNAAAGALKLLDLEKFKERGLEIALYQIAHDSRGQIDSLTKSWQALRTLNLVKNSWHMECREGSHILEAVAQAESQRPSLPFGIDGVVFKVDSYHAQEEMGSTGQYYRWAVAYKFTPQKAITKLLGIEFQVGRTGVITPVAQLAPVLVDGSSVQRASLYNADEIKRLDLRVGDWVELHKSGDIIPKLIRVLAHKRQQDALMWEIPTCCPSCNKPLFQDSDAVALRCINSYCDEQVQRALIYFCGKEALDIEGLGEKSLRLLYRLNLVRSVKELFCITAEQIENLEGFGSLSAKQITTQVMEKSAVPYARLILSLGLPGIGAGLAKILAKETESIWHLISMTQEQLLQIDGMGPVTGQELVRQFAQLKPFLVGRTVTQGPWQDVDFSTRSFLEILELIEQQVLKPIYPERLPVGEKRPLEGMSIVITGQFRAYSRKDLTERSELLGARVSSSVSAKTSVLLFGDKAGSKLEKAKKLGVQVFDEGETLQFLGLVEKPQ